MWFFYFLFISLLLHSWGQHTNPPSSSAPKTNRLNTQLPFQFLHICRKTFMTRLIPNLEECWWEKQVTGLCETRVAARGTPAQENTPSQHLHPSITALWPTGLTPPPTLPFTHAATVISDSLRALYQPQGVIVPDKHYCAVFIFADVPLDIHYASFFSVRSNI